MPTSLPSSNLFGPSPSCPSTIGQTVRGSSVVGVVELVTNAGLTLSGIPDNRSSPTLGHSPSAYSRTRPGGPIMALPSGSQIDQAT
ncbi:MAG: hypothetical protein F4213_13025 [Boseongicola sp. SB0677_bin_26]|nr:hypothetical protein [Boseongicola sp. SB0677_bin_26]